MTPYDPQSISSNNQRQPKKINRMRKMRREERHVENVDMGWWKISRRARHDGCTFLECILLSIIHFRTHNQSTPGMMSVCRDSNKALARMADSSPMAVANAIGKLVVDGYLERRGDGAKRYLKCTEKYQPNLNPEVMVSTENDDKNDSTNLNPGVMVLRSNLNPEIMVSTVLKEEEDKKNNFLRRKLNRGFADAKPRNKTIVDFPVKNSRIQREAVRIIEFWNSIPGITRHKNPDTKVYAESIRLLDKLLTGKLTTFKFEERFFKRQFPTQKRERRLSKIFSPDEIISVLSDYAEYLKEGNWPEDKSKLPRALPTLLYNPRTQRSWFVLAWNRGKPEEIEQRQPADIQAFVEVYPEFAETSSARRSDLHKLAADYREWWTRSVPDWTGVNNKHDGFAYRYWNGIDAGRYLFIVDFLQYVKSQPWMKGAPSPRALRIGGKLWNGWLDHVNDMWGGHADLRDPEVRDADRDADEIDIAAMVRELNGGSTAPRWIDQPRRESQDSGVVVPRDPLDFWADDDDDDGYGDDQDCDAK